MTLDVTLGVEDVKALLPGERRKRTLATSEHLGHVRVESSMPTMKGMARVTDVKTLVQEVSGEGGGGERMILYVQQLTIASDCTQKSHVTSRYFVPFHGELGPTALTSGGNKKKESMMASRRVAPAPKAA